MHPRGRELAEQFERKKNRQKKNHLAGLYQKGSDWTTHLPKRGSTGTACGRCQERVSTEAQSDGVIVHNWEEWDGDKQRIADAPWGGGQQQPMSSKSSDSGGQLKSSTQNDKRRRDQYKYTGNGVDVRQKRFLVHKWRPRRNRNLRICRL